MTFDSFHDDDRAELLWVGMHEDGLEVSLQTDEPGDIMWLRITREDAEELVAFIFSELVDSADCD